MNKIIIAILTFNIFAIGADHPTHYINNKWRICDEHTYDNQGNLIKEKYYWGFAYRNEYDSTNILQRSIDISDDFDVIYEYDYTFNEQNHVIQHAKCINSDECDEWWSEYDEKGNMIHEISDTRERWIEYDDKGSMIHMQVNRDDEDWYEYKYDKYSNPILVKTYNSKFSDTTYYNYEYFTSDGKRLKATYDYNKKNPYHIKPNGTVLKCISK